MSGNDLGREEARARARLISDVAYQVGLALTWKQDRFRSGTLLRFHCRAPGAETFLDLAASEIERIELNGRRLSPETFDGHRIRLPGLRRDNEVLVLAECSYEGGAGLHRFLDPTDGHTYCFTQPESPESHRIYACFNQPEVKATFELGVLAPAGWVVISNSHVVHRPPPASAGWWILARTPPLPPCAGAVVAGPYSSVTLRHRNIDLGLHCRQSLAPLLEVAEILQITSAGLDFYERVFDSPYPFGQSYDQVLVPELNPGRPPGPGANAGCMTLPEALILSSEATDAHRLSRAEIILREMAPMWSWEDPSVAAVREYLRQQARTSLTLHDFLSGLCELSRPHGEGRPSPR